MKRKIYVLSALAVFILLSFVFIIISISVGRDPDMTHLPDNCYSETLVVVADPEYPPYSYYNKAGEVVGSDIELLYAIANEMQVNVDLQLYPWPTPCDLVENGTADIVLGLEHANYYLEHFLLTQPVELSQFVAFGKKPYASLIELRRSRVGTISCSSTTALFSNPMGLVDSIIIYDSYESGFEAISAGQLDYFIGRYPIGNRVLAQMELSDICAVGDVLANTMLTFGVHLENESLLRRVNAAIETLDAQNVLQAISTKWLGDFTQTIHLHDYIKKHGFSLLGILLLLLVVVLIMMFCMIRKLHRKAQKDLTTGLYNKRETEQRIAALLQQNKLGALFMIDIDNLKIINDRHGHLAGDWCIEQIAYVLQAECGNESVLGRVGGDEFLCYSYNLQNAEQAQQHGQTICRRLASIGHSSDTVEMISASIGIAIATPESNFASLYEQADSALYSVKQSGKNGTSVFVASHSLFS